MYGRGDSEPRILPEISMSYRWPQITFCKQNVIAHEPILSILPAHVVAHHDQMTICIQIVIYQSYFKEVMSGKLSVHLKIRGGGIPCKCQSSSFQNYPSLRTQRALLQATQ